MKKFLLLTFTALISACGPTGHHANSSQSEMLAAIKSGRPAEPTEKGLESVVMLRFEISSDEDFICTGVLVAKQWVLTAAHCFENGATKYRLTVTQANIQSAGDSNSVLATHFTKPKDSVTDLENMQESKSDLALVKLERPLPYPAKPAALPENRKYNFEKYLMTGFGRALTSSSSGTLRMVEVPAYRMIEPNPIPFYVINQFHGYPGVNTGDSGGPLFGKTETEQTLIGITSFCSQSKEGPCSIVSRFTNLIPYLDWIRLTVGADLPRK